MHNTPNHNATNNTISSASDIDTKSGNLFTPLAPELSKGLSPEVFDTLAQGSNVRIERIVSMGHSTPKDDWYDQDEHEWVILLQGKAAIRFTGNAENTDKSSMTTLAPGDYINIPAHTRHRVEWTDSENPTIWLAIHYL